jgi:hypothetical protein
MLVSHRHRFIYTKTFKTGGTSVECFLEQFCVTDPERQFTEESEELVSEMGIVGFRGAKRPSDCKYWSHMPATAIKSAVGDKTWNEYFKFCVIRNPFEKLISAFYFSQHLMHGAVEFENIQEEASKFESWLKLHWRRYVDRDKYLMLDRFCLDAVVRYETLTRDLREVCRRLGIDNDASSVPGLKTNIRPPGAKASDLYSEKSREIIEEAFRFELDYFGYSFPAPVQTPGT